MTSVTVLDVKNICRVCLRSELNMRYMFDSKEKPSIAQMLSELTFHKVQHFEALPELICPDCLNMVFSAYKLKQQFERCNNILIRLLENKQTDVSSHKNFIDESNALEKSSQTDESFVSSCQCEDKKFLTPYVVEILEVETISSENQKSDTEKDKTLLDQLAKSHISKIYTEDSLSEEELLKLLEDDIQYLTNEEDEDELPLSMLIESSDTSQIIEDKTPNKKSKNLVVIKESELRATKSRRGKYNLKNKYALEKKDEKRKLVEHKESERPLSKFGKSNKKPKNRDKLFKCLKCNKNFSTKDYLQRHIEMHDKKRFVCKECFMEFLTKEELNVHGKAEGHDKPFLCPECGSRFKSSDILTVHLRRHNGEKPFKCKYCSKGFPRMGDMKIHEKYHTDEKSHFCDICGKGFFRKYNLRIHMRVHTGEKPYKCSHCPQAFAQSNDLKAHIRRHTGERFRCEVCNAAFLQGYQMRQHKLQKHGIHELPPTQRLQKFTSIEENK